MTFEEIKSKIESSTIITITEIKEIQHGKCIYLNNGGNVNCYNTGKYTVQGNGKKEIEAILERISNRKIFVVCGHDKIALIQLKALLEKWKLEPIVLSERASGGQTIIEQLEEYSSDVGGAIILGTPDDEGKAKDESTYKSRLRQNVVFEMGMFIAKLGRKHVAILLKEVDDLEKPSDIAGFKHIPFKNNVEERALDLIRELTNQGYEIDPKTI